MKEQFNEKNWKEKLKYKQYVLNVKKFILVETAEFRNVESTLQREVTLQVNFTGKRSDVGLRSPITTGKGPVLRYWNETTGRQRVSCVFSSHSNSTMSRVTSSSGQWLPATGYCEGFCQDDDSAAWVLWGILSVCSISVFSVHSDTFPLALFKSKVKKESGFSLAIRWFFYFFFRFDMTFTVGRALK